MQKCNISNSVNLSTRQMIIYLIPYYDESLTNERFVACGGLRAALHCGCRAAPSRRCGHGHSSYWYFGEGGAGERLAGIVLFAGRRGHGGEREGGGAGARAREPSASPLSAVTHMCVLFAGGGRGRGGGIAHRGRARHPHAARYDKGEGTSTRTNKSSW